MIKKTLSLVGPVALVGLLFAAMVLLGGLLPVRAATPTPSPSPETEDSILDVDEQQTIEEIKKRIEKELIKSALENYKMQIRFINEKIFELSRDSKVFRIHTNVTRLSRELRPFLKYNGLCLHEIDL